MSEFESLTDEQREFERSLQQLKPAPVSFDESALLFQAGRAAGRLESRRSLRRWQCSTLAASLCAMLAIGLNGFAPGTASDFDRTVAVGSPEAETNTVTVSDNLPELEETEIVAVEPKADPAPSESRNVPEPTTIRATTAIGRWWEGLLTVSVSDQDSYLGLRNRVLEQGVDALPPSTGGGHDTGSEPLTSSPRQTRELLESAFPSQI
ncbi:MAG TPA: hypothetical protein VLA12_05990 [Planctomycetaceae bacterium]|nr:hypothetical protein [Planctomycetaceae bacterium]